MKITVTISGIRSRHVAQVRYILGPCADDEYILDPREDVPQSHSITITLNQPADVTIDEIAEAVEHFAFGFHKRYTVRKVGQ